ncbi:hypothetical protein B296_00043452 [Ensete ventricosum]|uniref:Transposase (putative) gypsy type domain-containing protein n=1 Tax=Ensete ventricosum TaxID=4639 RepID=A0A426XT43_ENSVE|nr:hypothetical protein B296_00043452 [Ensete ventricosum]
MKADHDLDTVVTEGSLAVIRGRYSIPTEYGLHVPRPRQRPYSSDTPDICISVDALETGLQFPLHPIIEECLRWWRISPSQVAPNSWRYLVVFLGECRGAGIIPTRDLFMACFRFCKSRGGCYLTARVGVQVSGAPSRYLFVSGPVWGFRLDLSEEEFVLVDILKGILFSSCAIKEMTELWLVKAGLSPASKDQMDLDGLRGMPKMTRGKAPSTRAIAPAREVGQVEGVEELDESLEELVNRRGVREGTSPPLAGAAAIHAPLREPTLPDGALRPVHDVGRLITFMDYRISHLQQELDALKFGGGPEAIAKAEERASVLEQELEKSKRERDEALQRQDASEKELSEVRSNLAALENARAELPKQMVDRYKESTGFKDGLKRMGRVTYKYGYRVVLARFHAVYLDSEVEEGPFTIHLEDDLVPKERQQAFNDSDTPES